MTTNLKDLEKTANLLRRDILNISYHGQVGHIGSALSVVDIITTLYFHIAKLYPNKPNHPDRDRIILSKGHACSALYSALYRRGYFSKKTLYTYHQNHSLLAGHPDILCPGVDASTGSLGHGLSLGIGMALAAKLQKRNYQVFVILSDGECNEGSTWEAALSAPQLKLNNLTTIIDYNKIQAFGRTKDVIDLEPFKQKWQSFGWRTLELNGHSLSQLTKALNSPNRPSSKPTVIIAHTVLGKGVSFMENNLEWHYWTPTIKHFNQAMKELKSSL
ncbi:transketolase [Patescibacteria group bacterium]|nr:transketolase [Patescibacteria group bacterium]